MSPCLQCFFQLNFASLIKPSLRAMRGKQGDNTMMAFTLNLSNGVLQDLELQLTKARKRGDFNETNRVSAILALGSGHFIDDVASILNIAVSSIYQWLRQFICSGIKGLISKKKPGRPSKLTKSQKKELSKYIEIGPEACGFESACWCTPMVQELIKEKFGVFYNVHYLSELLGNMGFSYQKAKFVAANRDDEKRNEWLENTWHNILKEAMKVNGYILFGDEASFPQWGSLSYTWSRKGKQPVVKTSGSRKAYKVLGAIDYFTGKFFAKGHHGKLNADIYIDYLKAILNKTRKHIFLIQDGAP